MTDLTPECSQGYRRGDGQTLADCGHYFSSDAWLAWEAGYALAKTIQPAAPIKCRKSRGYSLVITCEDGTIFRYVRTGRRLEWVDLIQLD